MNQDDSIDMNLSEYDHYFYFGAISMTGYYRLCSEIEKHKNKDKVILCLTTFGGDPDAGFRIGRALQHHYNGDVTIYIPNVCKSAGTLTAISAKKIIMNNKGELGPLDVQLRKDDELGANNSGLDIFKTLDTLEDRVNSSFNRYLRSVRFGQGLSTRMSADIATKLTAIIINPIAEQIDPMKIGEHQRATDIAIEYGNRLNQTSQCLKDNEMSLEKLIRGYPSHGFVIDRKEAKTIFSCVSAATSDIIEKFSLIEKLAESSPSTIGRELYVEYLKDVQNDDTNSSNETLDTEKQEPNDSFEGGSSESSKKNPSKASRTSSNARNS